MTSAWYMQSIYHVYTQYILSCCKTWLLGKIELVPWNAMLHTCISTFSDIHCVFENWWNLNITDSGICIAYPMHILRIYLVYTMYLCYLDLKDKYAVLRFSGCTITLSSPMAWVYSTRIQLNLNTWKFIFNILCIYMVYTMYMQALGIYMVYTWYVPCIIFIRVPDVRNYSEFQVT